VWPGSTLPPNAKPPRRRGKGGQGRNDPSSIERLRVKAAHADVRQVIATARSIAMGSGGAHA
jgi:hypothetical protein